MVLSCRMCSAGFVSAALAAATMAAPAYINGVPDWNQPILGGGAPGGPNGPWGAWCVPSATANIVGFYNDAGVPGIGDNMPYPGSPAWGAPGYRDDSAMPAAVRTDLGWYYDTNGLGVGGLAGHRGTRLVDILPGLVGAGYFPSHGIGTASVTNYGAITMPAALYPQFDTTGAVQGTHTLANGFNFIKNEIDASRPLLGHFSHFNLINRLVVADVNNFFPGPSYDTAVWGAPPPVFPVAQTDTGEVWDPNEGLGHTATITGYWLANDQANPLFGTDAIIMHDNSDGDLGGIAKPLVLPWNVAANPWQGLTAIANVPSPGAMVLLLGAGIAVMRRRR